MKFFDEKGRDLSVFRPLHGPKSDSLDRENRDYAEMLRKFQALSNAGPQVGPKVWSPTMIVETVES